MAILALGSTGITSFRTSAPSREAVQPLAHAVRERDGDGIGADPRVRAFVQAYAALIDSVAYLDEDAVFFLGSRPIRFQGGRMLLKGRGEEASAFSPIFYRYPLEPLVRPPPPTEEVVSSTDLLESLFGRTESVIREHCRSTRFLDHRLLVNTLLLEPLRAVESDIRDAARRDPAVARWIDDLDVVYSFIDRTVAGSATRSYHAWGMAVDLRPTSFGGKHVYWRWSRARIGQAWPRIPIAQRWSPPQAVIEAFERQGFVWGGKWYHFDTIHFEYRPEILLYNRLTSPGEGSVPGGTSKGTDRPGLVRSPAQ